MALRRLGDAKRIVIVVFVAFGVFVTLSTYKYLAAVDKSYGYTSSSSSSLTPTCELPGAFFKVVEKIMAPTLTQAMPIFPDIKNHKCIDLIKWKPIQPLVTGEIDQYAKCLAKNINPKQVSVNTHKRLDWSVNHAFFSFLKKKSDVAIIEVGGYTGNLLKKLIPATGAKYYVVIEPVPSFYKKLTQTISTLQLGSAMKTYNFGLGKKREKIQISVRGDATAISKSSAATGTEIINIVSTLDFFIQLGVGCRSVDLLTINCEGCEFVVLETLIATNLIEGFNYIQFQPHHAVSNLGHFPCRYCRLRQLLARTHELAYDYPQVWQAWKKRGI